MAYLTVVNNVADMLALNHVAVVSGVRTMGYYAPGDGGGGIYRMDLNDTTTPSDGVLVHVSSDGVRYKLEPANGVVNLKQGGARGNSNGTPGNGFDDTARIQETINAVGHGPIYVPVGVYRTTAVINVGFATKIYGDGYSVNRGGDTLVGSSIEKGSWFYFDHTGKGFYLTTTMQGGLFRGIATFRNQPASFSSGWAAADNDFDFYMNPSSTEWSWEDVMVLNPTRGFFLSNRPRLQNVRGQPLLTGIYVDQSYDTGRYESIHFWPYWADNQYVTSYMMNNLTMYQFLRADNHSLLNCFGIFACWGVRIQQGVTGTASKLRITSCDFDSTGYAIIIEPGANAATVQISNVSIQGGLSTQPFGVGLFINANNCRVMASALSGVYCYSGIVRIEGSGNKVQIGSVEGVDWDAGKQGFNAVYCASGNYCAVGTYVLSNTVSGDALNFGGSVKVYLGASFASGTTDSNGVINIPHGLKAKPLVVNVEPVSDSAMMTVVMATSSTTATVKFRQTGNAAPYVNTPIAFQIAYHDV